MLLGAPEAVFPTRCIQHDRLRQSRISGAPDPACCWVSMYLETKETLGLVCRGETLVFGEKLSHASSNVQQATARWSVEHDFDGTK